jgi:glycosyltransferase involved in cell wall biosynthesis
LRPLQISEISYSKLPPDFHEKNQQILTEQVQLVLDQLQWRCPLLWINDPFTVDTIGALNECGVVYDCIDSFSSFSWSNSAVQKWENQLIRKASIILTTAKKLYHNHSVINSATYLVPNAADFGHFSNVETMPNIPADLQSIHQPRVGFIGAIYEWLDFALLERLAHERPDWNLVLVGPKQHNVEIPKADNIFWLGVKEYRELPNYLHHLDIMLIPFLINETTINANPIKMWEYLAGGKMIVATDIPEIPDIPGVIRVSHDHEEFIHHCAHALDTLYHHSQNSLISKARSIAEANSWDERCRTIINILKKHFGPQGSQFHNPKE